MHFSRNLRRWLIAAVTVVVIGAIGFAVIAPRHTDKTEPQRPGLAQPLERSVNKGAVSVQAAAYSTVCKTIFVKNSFWFAPYTLMYGLHVPICYNGSTVWVNGGISPWVWSIGWSTSTTWSNYYNDSSHRWLAVGENITATWLKVAMTFTLLPRWYINANGQVYSYVNS